MGPFARFSPEGFFTQIQAISFRGWKLRHFFSPAGLFYPNPNHLISGMEAKTLFLPCRCLFYPNPNHLISGLEAKTRFSPGGSFICWLGHDFPLEVHLLVWLPEALRSTRTDSAASTSARRAWRRRRSPKRWAVPSASWPSGGRRRLDSHQFVERKTWFLPIWVNYNDLTRPHPVVYVGNSPPTTLFQVCEIL